MSSVQPESRMAAKSWELGLEELAYLGHQLGHDFAGHLEVCLLHFLRACREDQVVRGW